MNNEFGYDYALDTDVSECLSRMYLAMINEEEFYLKQFRESYNRIDKDAQDYVYKEYNNIISTNNKNAEKGYTLKKKGMNYNE